MWPVDEIALGERVAITSDNGLCPVQFICNISLIRAGRKIIMLLNKTYEEIAGNLPAGSERHYSRRRVLIYHAIFKDKLDA